MNGITLSLMRSHERYLDIHVISMSTYNLIIQVHIVIWHMSFEPQVSNQWYIIMYFLVL